MSENSKFKYSGLSHETSLKVGVSQPLDTRTVVLNKTDLISDSVTKYAYYGMIVYVEEDKKQYYLDGNSKGEPNMSAAASNLDNWKEVGSELSNLSVNSKITTASSQSSTADISTLTVKDTFKLSIYDKSGNKTDKYASLQIIETEDGNLTIEIKKLDN